MGGYKQISGKDGNTFSSTNQPANRGRKKKIYTVLRDLGYSGDDIRTGFQELAFYSIDELNAVKDDESLPVIVRIISNQFLTAFKQGDWTKVKDLLEHVLGKPSQKIEQQNKIDFNVDPFAQIRLNAGITDED